MAELPSCSDTVDVDASANKPWPLARAYSRTLALRGESGPSANVYSRELDRSRTALTACQATRKTATPMMMVGYHENLSSKESNDAAIMNRAARLRVVRS